MKYDLEYVLDSASDGIFIVAKDHRLVLFNRACEDLYGISRDDLIEKACWKITDFKRSWAENSHGGKDTVYGELATKRERMTLKHKRGREVWVETIFTPIFDKENKDIAYIMGVIKDISEQKRLEEEKEKLLVQLDFMRGELEVKFDFSKILGHSSEIISVLKLAGEVAKKNTTVLLFGESGTGKELFAKAIHYNSLRASNPFVAVNCSAFPDTLIESELFGYEKGAFTGADKSKPGKVQMADGGSLFLDEVADLSPPAQAKLLRLIQEREYEPLGGVKILKTNIRIIAATNKDIFNLVQTGKFREDLYYRLYVYPITLPPLRERIEDIPVLVDDLIRKKNREMGKNILGLTPRAEEILLQYSWPGNIRELQNVIERLVILAKGKYIEASELPHYLSRNLRVSTSHRESIDSLPEGKPLEEFIQEWESDTILRTLKKCGFNKTQAAKELGLTRSTLRYKLSKISAKN